MRNIIKQTFKIKYKYNIIFTNKIFNKKNKCLKNIFLEEENKKLIIFIDKNVTKYHTTLESDIHEYFKEINENVLLKTIIKITGGEKIKNHSLILKYIYSVIEKNKICRHSYIICIGGGAILDLICFAASTAHRGIKIIRIPTTVLSQNDSGIGVKNGINFVNKKNFIGTFAIPYAVINDHSFLKSLTMRIWKSGISEAIKVALIKDKTFFDYIYINIKNLNDRNNKIIKEVIYKCAKLHAHHISKNGDPFETKSARPLDFGHWIAHKLESITKYKLLHGEAVAIGIAIDSTYSYLIKLLSKTEWKKIIEVLYKLKFNLYLKELTILKNNKLLIFDGLSEFKEHLGGKLTVTLLKGIGTQINVNEVNESLYTKSILLLKKYMFLKKNNTEKK